MNLNDNQVASCLPPEAAIRKEVIQFSTLMTLSLYPELPAAVNAFAFSLLSDFSF